MNRALGIALLVGGIVLLIFGFQAGDSAMSEVKEVFTGTPTDKSVWMLVVGAVATAIGSYFTLASRRA